MRYSVLILGVLLQYSISVPTDHYSLNQINNEVTELISTQSKEIVAAGRVADLGDLYDERTDSFLEVSLYTKEINIEDGDMVHSANITYSEIDYVVTETIKEKMQKLGVEGSLAINAMSGKIRLEGSAKYLSENKKKYKSAKTSLVYNSKTKQEHLKIFSAKSKNAIDKYLLKSMDATHVVIGLEWGANAILSVEETNTESLNVQDIVGDLKGKLDLGILNVTGANGTLEDYEFEKSSSFTLRLHADIIPNKIPQTVKDALAFITDIPLLMKTENNGRGKIVKFILMPIATVRRVLKCESNKQTTVWSLEKSLMDEILQIFQEMTDSQLQINDAYNDIAKWTFMIHENEHEEISKEKNQFDLFFNHLKLNFSDQMVQYKSGKSDAKVLNGLIAEYRNSPWTPASVEQLLKIYGPSLRKIRLMDLMESYNARFIDRRTDKYHILAMNYRQEIKIISMNLRSGIESSYVRKIVKLLKAEMEKGSKGELKPVTLGNETNPENESKPVPHFIKDDPDCTIPRVSVYCEGRLTNSYSLNKTEYVLLISEFGEHIAVINATSFITIHKFSEKGLENSSFAVINNLVYSVDRIKGEIKSAFIDDFFKTQTQPAINWQLVGSFPPEPAGSSRNAISIQSIPNKIDPVFDFINATKSNIAVNGSSFYFTLYNGDLYKYDTTFKTVTFKANIDDCIEKCDFDCKYPSSMIIYNGILYIHDYGDFCQLDGKVPKKLAKPSIQSIRTGLFVAQNRLCIVARSDNNVIFCYDAKNDTWSGIGNPEASTNEVRHCPGVVTTLSGTLIFGGSFGDFISAEIFNEETFTSSYIPTPKSLMKDCYTAFSVWH